MRMIHKTQASLCIFASEGNGLLVVPGTHREDIRLSYGMPDAINERDQHTALTGQFKLTAEAEERAELVRLCLSFNLSFQARFAHIHIVANGSFPKPVEFLSFFLRNLISPTLRSFFCVFVRFSLFFFRFLEIVSCGNSTSHFSNSYGIDLLASKSSPFRYPHQITNCSDTRAQTSIALVLTIPFSYLTVICCDPSVRQYLFHRRGPFGSRRLLHLQSSYISCNSRNSSRRNGG